MAGRAARRARLRGVPGGTRFPGPRFARSALAAVTTFAWTVPGLHRVQLFVEPSNEASVRTARSAGYEPEGLLRSYLEIGGRRRDMLVFGAVRGS